MFKFITNENEKAKVTEEYVDSIEKKLNIKFPEILREYYLKHNGAEMEECTFELYDVEFSVYSICDLNYGTMPVEKILEFNSKNQDIPKECYPIAEDDINNYYWNTKDGKVYYYMVDEDQPTIICESVEEFFEILNSVCEGTIKVEGKEENRPNPYLNSIDIEKAKDKGNVDVERILKYDGKLIKICILTLVVLVIISLMLTKITDSLSLIFVGVFGIWIPFFAIIDIVNRSTTKKALNKYDINEIKKELQEKDVVKLKGIETYLTENYIISNSKSLKITKYDEIKWTYVAKPIGTVAQQGAVSIAYKYGGTPVIAYLNNGKYVNIALIKSAEHMNMIFGLIRKKSKGVLIGNSMEDMKKYAEMNSKYKRKLAINYIIFCLVFIIMIIAITYKIFS